MASEYSPDIPLREVNTKVLEATKTPVTTYFIILVLLALGIGLGLFAWIFQVRTGMGATGLNHPIGWATYIGNFVFWVGIAHSGTLISAILFLVRAKWRDAVSRSAEAMTIFAIMTAGLFPLIHLGRLWVFYYIIPYPSERQIWPDFISPLVWDLVAVSTYLTVSIIFFFVGLIPDSAAARDRATFKYGANHWRSKFYKAISLGWSGSLYQWRHYNRAYLYFAALATPLVVSVHSVVSWDFAMGLLPGWHSTIFAPYFVAGAIHSGLAMVITIIVPLRKLLHLEELITPKHIEMVAKTIVVTALIVGYAYIVEPLIAAYSNNIYEQQFAIWRRTGWASWIYWSLAPLNVIFPLGFLFKKVRLNLRLAFAIAILINVGMWLERLFIVMGSTAHDFLPHAWDSYSPSWVEISVTIGSFSFFFFWFLVFSKTLPAIPLTDYKGQLEEDKITDIKECNSPHKIVKINEYMTRAVFIFSDPNNLLEAVKKVCQSGYNKLDVFSPIKLEQIEKILKIPNSPVRFWTLLGALFGFASGFALTLSTALQNGLIAGGKTPVSLLPYWIIAFELTILFGSIGNLIGVIIHAKLYGKGTVPAYNTKFSSDKFGLVVECGHDEFEKIKSIVSSAGPEESNFEKPDLM